MPVYDYKCTTCKNEFEKTLKIADLDDKKKKVRCPVCHSSRVKRSYTKPATVQYKGSGFYITDKDKK